MKKNLFIIFLLSTSFIYGFATEIQEDPFELDLDLYKKNQSFGSDVMLYSAICLGTGFVAGSTFSTMNSIGIIDNQVSTPGVIISYATVSISAITLVIGFLIWKNSTELYLDTLRLQTQYYNLVEY